MTALAWGAALCALTACGEGTPRGEELVRPAEREPVPVAREALRQTPEERQAGQRELGEELGEDLPPAPAP